MTQSRTLPHPSSAIDIAVAALFAQGQYGAVTDIAHEHGIRRQKVYDLREQAQVALYDTFDLDADSACEADTLCVARPDIRRAIVALRTMTPSSIRDIQDVLPVLFDTKVSYGTVWNVVHEAEQRAAELNRRVNLYGIDTIAVDEMFSQGQPVFAGIDLSTGYLFLLEPHRCRTGPEWEDALGSLRDTQRLAPQVVVKDAGSGLARGVRLAYPCIEERDDLFHAVFEMGKRQVRLERRAYTQLEAYDELSQQRAVAQTESERRSLGQQLRAAHAKMMAAIERHDRFETLLRRAGSLLELSDRGCGRLRTRGELVLGLQAVAAQMRALGGRDIGSVAKYLHNRADGLGRYLDGLSESFLPVEQQLGTALVEAVVRAYQASLMVHRKGPRWDQAARRSELRCAVTALVDAAAGDHGRLLAALSGVVPMLAMRHRASSAIENLNSVLRPHLVVQKHANAGFMQLFQFHWNRRQRRWGRHAGSSAHEVLTGEASCDWLTVLGFPPSPERAAAA